MNNKNETASSPKVEASGVFNWANFIFYGLINLFFHCVFALAYNFKKLSNIKKICNDSSVLVSHILHYVELADHQSTFLKQSIVDRNKIIQKLQFYWICCFFKTNKMTKNYEVRAQQLLNVSLTDFKKLILHVFGRQQLTVDIVNNLTDFNYDNFNKFYDIIISYSLDSATNLMTSESYLRYEKAEVLPKFQQEDIFRVKYNFDQINSYLHSADKCFQNDTFSLKISTSYLRQAIILILSIKTDLAIYQKHDPQNQTIQQIIDHLNYIRHELDTFQEILKDINWNFGFAFSPDSYNMPNYIRNALTYFRYLSLLFANEKYDIVGATGTIEQTITDFIQTLDNVFQPPPPPH